MADGALTGHTRLTKKDRKRDRLLDEAAVEFNARGIAGASIAAIAKRVGLTRAAVYYYVADRQELACGAYRRACARMRDDLRAAGEERDGLSRCLSFIHRTLEPARSPPAVLSEISGLGPRRAADIRRSHGRNVATLRSFVEAGIQDGRIRNCDVEIAAHTIIGMLAWVPLSEHWVSGHEGSAEGYRLRVQKALLDLVESGIAADPSQPVECPASIGAFARMPANPFDRRQAAESKIDTLLRIACRHFNVKGIEGTTLEDIAAELGTTKGALYHYFPDKRALVVQCYRRSFDLHDRFAAMAHEIGRTGLERGMIGIHLNAQGLASPLSPLMPQVGINAFPAKLRREFVGRARALKREFESFGAQGLEDGSCRPCDLSMISLIGAGAFGWLPKWLPHDDPRSPAFIADEIVSLFVSGLRRR